MLFPILFASCSKIEDLYEEKKNESNSLFPAGVNIPENFNWSTTKEVEINISVNDQYDGKFDYLIELYNSDPFFAENAQLLGAGLAKAGKDYYGKIDIPSSLEYIYVKQTDPKGNSSLTMLKVTEAVLKQSSLLSSNLKGTGKIRMSTSDQPKTVAVGGLGAVSARQVPADAIAISGSNDVSLQSNKSYVVKENSTFTGNIIANNGSTNALVYIEGVWNAPNNTLDIGASNGLFVTQKGSVKLAGIKQNTQGSLESYGRIELDALSITNEVVYRNFGEMTVRIASISNGSLINFGKAIIGKIESTTSSTLIQNQGTLMVSAANLTNATLLTNCHTEIATFINNGAKVKVASGALLSIGTLQSNGTTYTLEATAIMDVKKTAYFSDNKSFVEGIGNNFALVRMSKVEIVGWEALNYVGNVQIACSEHTPNGQWDRKYTITSPATIVPLDQTTLEIPASACNQGGNNDDSNGSNPENQTPPEVALEPYTFAFEDNWPKKGDYDMNDFGVEIRVVKTQNRENKVLKVKLSAKITSVGAARRLAAAIQLDGISVGNIKSVKYSRSDLLGQAFSLDSKGVEKDQRYAVVGLVGDAHRAFGISQVAFISTQNGSFKPIELDITIEFNAPLDGFTQKALNPFIFTESQNGAGRSEIHLVGHSATDKMNIALKEKAVKAGDVSVSDIFKTQMGEPWALSVPISFQFPTEGRDITKHYPKFMEWAKSGGVIQTGWYNDFQK